MLAIWFEGAYSLQIPLGLVQGRATTIVWPPQRICQVERRILQDRFSPSAWTSSNSSLLVRDHKFSSFSRVPFQHSFMESCCLFAFRPFVVWLHCNQNRCSTFLTENHNYLKYSVYWQLSKNPNGLECIFEEMESLYNFYILVQVQFRCFIFQCQVFRRRILRCYLASSFVSSLDVKQIGIQGPSTCLFFNTLCSPVSAALSIMGLDVSCPWVVTSWAY